MNETPVNWKEEVDELVHLYVDGAFSRRDLLRRVTGVTGSAAAAAAALEGLLPAEADAQTTAGCPDDVRVPENAPDLESGMVEFGGRSGKLYAYLSRPRAARDPQPGVLVIHENRGLNDHIMDVTRRVARAGYIALGVDLLSRKGGTAAFPDPVQATAAFRDITNEMMLDDMQDSMHWLKTQSFTNWQRIGSVGFCMGGDNSFNLAFNTPDMSAAVVFYGNPVNADLLLGELQVPLLMIFAERDRRLTMRIAPVMTRLLELQKPFAFHVYEGVGHAFNNDTGANYNREAACDAWARTLAYFARHLRRAE